MEIENFVSVWADGKTLPKSYIFPENQRPGNSILSKKSLPVVDLQNATTNIIEATQEFGSFQLTNHGIPRDLMDEVRAVYKEFFKLPLEDKSKFCSNDNNKKFYLYTSSNEYATEPLHFWRDVVRKKSTPLEECIPHWPENPARYREVIAEFVREVNKVASKLMEYICEGIGLEPKYLEENLSLESGMAVNHYPPCPDPSLTLGIGRHSDRSLVTIIMQDDVPGLQIWNDGEWIAVEPNPEALVITVGYILQAVSNGKVTCGDHRVVTNDKRARESVSLIVIPTSDCLIEPAKPLLNADNPPLYRAFTFDEFMKSHAQCRELKNEESSLKPFLIN